MNSSIRFHVIVYMAILLTPQSTSADRTFSESSVWRTRGMFKNVQHGKYHLNLTACAETLNATTLHIMDGDIIEIGSEMLPTDEYTCSFQIQVENPKYLHFLLEDFVLLPDKEYRQVCFGSGWITVVGRSDTVSTFPVCGVDRVWTTVPSSDGKISMHMQVSSIMSPTLYLSLKLTFKSAALPVTEMLSHAQTSPNSYSLTNFLFTGRARVMPTETVIYHLIPGLLVGTTMLSVPHMGIYKEGHLILWVHGEWLTSPGLEYRYLFGTSPDPASLLTGNVTVGYRAGTNAASTGFKLLYSYHGVAETPQFETDEGTTKWNCSVPFYEDFKQHLHCNLVRECQGLEDEADCPYTSAECGPGNMDAGTKCYRHFKLYNLRTWHTADKQCKMNNMTLVSPKTPHQWQRFSRIMEFGLSSSDVFVGLSSRIAKPGLLQNIQWQWRDGTVAYFLPHWSKQDYTHESCMIFDRAARVHVCSQCSLSVGPSMLTKRIDCNNMVVQMEDLICEYPKPGGTSPAQSDTHNLGPKMRSSDARLDDSIFFTCPDGHMVHNFMSCDKDSQCGLEEHIDTCTIPGTEISIPMFACDLGAQTLHYTLVCDNHADCLDRSDESFCTYETCHPTQFTCRNGRCTFGRQCNGIRDCIDESDEEDCSSVLTLPYTIPPPAVVDIDWRGEAELRSLANGTCPETHFKCKEGYCLPVFLYCNGVPDCFDHDDEADCEAYKCPGFYRCRGSKVCVHVDHVGDTIPQCPQHDDELLRKDECPWVCKCQGLALICPFAIGARSYPLIRYLDSDGSRQSLAHVRHNRLLIRLSLSACGIHDIDELKLPNLQYIDLSHNQITSIKGSAFSGSPNLRVIVLAGNPLVSFESFGLYAGSSSLTVLDISHTRLSKFDRTMLDSFIGLRHLAATNITLESIADNFFASIPRLETLDLRDSSLPELPQNLLQNLSSLTAVSASDFRLCCPDVLPEKFTMKFCEAPQDEISSCEDLLRSDFYRACLWPMTLLAVTGNMVSLATRFLRQRATKTASFSVLVTNLNMADLLMGIYMVMIGAADMAYRDSYLWQESSWKNSAVCKAAGFLCLWASEVSAFFICLITLDRFLALRFVFGGIRLTVRCAVVACCLAWLAGFVLALVPLLPATAHWLFYSQTGICIPLPITRDTTRGHGYAFGVMVVFNFFVFLLIAVGQLLIYVSVRQHSFTSDTRNSQDATVARRLTTIVLSDFLCWFPIGALGLLASRGFPVSGELNVVMAIFVLPLNSAINPFLYTLSIVLERSRKAAEARLLERLTKTLVSQRRTREVGVATDEKLMWPADVFMAR